MSTHDDPSQALDGLFNAAVGSRRPDTASGQRARTVSRLQDAPPGAQSADCAVCGRGTYSRLVVGEGHVPICDEGCERAWPRVRDLLAANAGLAQRLRLVAWWCGADEAAIRRAERKLPTTPPIGTGESR